METNEFENWQPKMVWINNAGGQIAIGWHCAVPQDDCGCKDCQERHGYKSWYDKETKSFYEERNGEITKQHTPNVIPLSDYVKEHGITKEVQWQLEVYKEAKELYPDLF